ncbi:hypothetical protein CUMW_121640, partial [Citrus unshiu]
TTNRDRQIIGQGFRASLRRNGAMVIIDINGKVIWMTSTTSNGADRVELLDTRHLVLKDMHDNIGSFSSSYEFKFSAIGMGFRIKRRLTMDYDRNLRLYSLKEVTRLWMISWQAGMQPSKVHGVCGKYGILYTTVLKCSCPSAYKATELVDWSYIAPEWASDIPIIAKVDVYTNGVVVLAMDGEGQEAELKRFVKEVKKKILYGEEAWIEEIVDPRLKGNFNMNQAATLIGIGISMWKKIEAKDQQ